MTGAKRQPREVTVVEIGKQFELASYWFGGTWCPAVQRNADGAYSIRILRSQTLTTNGQQVSYDYFEVDADGTITTAPRGHAKDFRPGRVVDIEAAAKRFEEHDRSCTQLLLAGDR